MKLAPFVLFDTLNRAKKQGGYFMAEKLELFTTSTCPACQQAKRYLDEKNIEYTEYDVAEDEEARTKMVEETGQMVVPIIKKGQDYVVGFDREKLEDLL